MQNTVRRLLIHGFAALIVGWGIYILLAAFDSSASVPPSWLIVWSSRVDADPSLRLRILIVLFAGMAGIRLILAGLLAPPRPWSVVIGSTILALTLASELPAFL